MFGVPVMRFRLKIEVSDSGLGSDFRVHVRDSGLGFVFGFIIWDSGLGF